MAISKKIIITVCLILVSALLFTACSKKSDSKDDKGAGNITDTIKNMTVGSFKLQYKGFEIVDDDHGNKALAVNIKFFNNSGEPASMFWSIYDIAVQNGTELEWAYVSEDSDRNLISDSCSKKVQNGDSCECVLTYVLQNTTDSVTITFTDSEGGSPQALTIDVRKGK